MDSPITFDLTGLNNVYANLMTAETKVINAVKRSVKDTVKYAEREIAQEISLLDAVDTGRLLGSFHGTSSVAQAGDRIADIASDGLSAVVGTAVPYAIPVHTGYTREVQSANGMRFVRGRGRGSNQYRARRRLVISSGTYSRDHQGTFTLHVQGRPFVTNTMPKVQNYFTSTASQEVTDAIRGN